MSVFRYFILSPLLRYFLSFPSYFQANCEPTSCAIEDRLLTGNPVISWVFGVNYV